MRISILILFITAALGSSSAFAAGSSIIEGMNLTVTGPSLSMSVHAAKVFLSIDGRAMSAANATLEVSLAESAIRQHFACRSLRFELRTNFAVCDSREDGRGKSVMIDGSTGTLSRF